MCEFTRDCAVKRCVRIARTRCMNFILPITIARWSCEQIVTNNNIINYGCRSLLAMQIPDPAVNWVWCAVFPSMLPHTVHAVTFHNFPDSALLSMIIVQTWQNHVRAIVSITSKSLKNHTGEEGWRNVNWQFSEKNAWNALLMPNHKNLALDSVQQEGTMPVLGSHDCIPSIAPQNNRSIQVNFTYLLHKLYAWSQILKRVGIGSRFGWEIWKLVISCANSVRFCWLSHFQKFRNFPENSFSFCSNHPRRDMSVLFFIIHDLAFNLARGLQVCLRNWHQK